MTDLEQIKFRLMLLIIMAGVTFGMLLGHVVEHIKEHH